MVDQRGCAFAGRSRPVRFRYRQLPTSGCRVWPFLATDRRTAALEFLDHLAGWVKAPAVRQGSPAACGTAFSVSGLDAGVGDGGCVRGGQVEELCGPDEDLPEGVARELSLVGPVPGHLPRLSAWWK